MKVQWTPIEVYDAMKTKPKAFVVFLVAEMKSGRSTLSQTIRLERRFGFRTVTHFCVLPDVPKGDAE